MFFRTGSRVLSHRASFLPSFSLINNATAKVLRTRNSASNTSIIRHFTASTLVRTATGDNNAVSPPSIDTIPTIPDAAASTADATVAIADAIVTASPELSLFKPTHAVMAAIEHIHIVADIPYWEAIAVMTIILRFLMLPLAIKTMQNASRMAVLRPHMQKMQEAFTKDPHYEDMRVKLKYQNDMKALFVTHKVNPFRSMLMPLVQLPVFVTFFLALQAMGGVYPGMATGGDLWFVDLTAADPYYIFPIANAVSFLFMLELGADGIETSQQETFKWAMRGLAVAMGPLTMSMPQAVFIYWTTNNAISIVQTLILKQENVRIYFDIPKPPAPADTPALKMKNPFAAIGEMVQRETSRNVDARAEIVDAKEKPPPPPPGGPPPQTFAKPPSSRSKTKKHMK